MTDQLTLHIARLTERLEMLEAQLLSARFTDPAAMAQLCATMLRKRQSAFPKGYFSDASWEILLDLFIAKNNHRKLIVSDLGLSANLPSTTVLRHLARLVDDGFVRRDFDPLDRRKYYVRLTEHGSNVMIDILQHTANATIKALSAQPVKSVMY